MVFLESFHMLSRDEDEDFLFFNPKFFRTDYNTCYPFVLFRERELPDNFEFFDITIFCGGNGSGKSTILNVIAEKLGLSRSTPYNRSDFFDDYIERCKYKLNKEPPHGSRIITSDDVFDKILDIRRLNDGIDHRRYELVDEFLEERGKAVAGVPNNLNGLEDYERWKNAHEARKKRTTQSKFIRDRLMFNVPERSNGESALAYFMETVTTGALYLLDEPENNLSPANQINLKYLIEDSVRRLGCQFIISTHSPFLLSLRRAKIYDIDSVPPRVRRWTELEGVRAYYDFFEEHKDQFTV